MLNGIVGIAWLFSSMCVAGFTCDLAEEESRYNRRVSALALIVSVFVLVLTSIVLATNFDA